MNDLNKQQAGEREAFTAAYMKSCENKAPDHNEIGLHYFHSGWRAALAQPTSDTPAAEGQFTTDCAELNDLLDATYWMGKGPNNHDTVMRWSDALDKVLPMLTPAASASTAGLKDHHIAALVNELASIAREFHGAQQLRERIAHVVVPVLKNGPICARCNDTGWREEGDPETGGNRVPCSAYSPPPAAEQGDAEKVDLIARGMSWAQTEALMREACAQAGVAWGDDKKPQDLAINVMQRLANAAHKVGFTLGLERAGQATKPAAAQAPEVGDEPMPAGAPFGIIDPDYARYYTLIRVTAWQCGYAIAIHGSFTRDLDLIAVPWTPQAFTPDLLLNQIEWRTDLKRQGPPSEKPLGRLACTLLLPGEKDPRWIDLSIAPRVAPTQASAHAEADALDAARLDWLDATNARFKMGWQVGEAPAGNVSVQSVIHLAGTPTSIRDAIDVARALEGTGER